MFLIIVRHGRCDYPILGVRTGALESGQRGQATGTEPAGPELGICGDRKALLSAKLLTASPTSLPLQRHHHCPLAVLLGDLRGEKHFPRSGQTRKHISHPARWSDTSQPGGKERERKEDFCSLGETAQAPDPRGLNGGSVRTEILEMKTPCTHTPRENGWGIFLRPKAPWQS